LRPFRSTLVLVTAAILGITTAAHAVLAPTKASQLVTVYGSGSCPLTGFNAQNSQVLSFVVHADSSTSPFTIPPKQVFVLTDVTTTGYGNVPSDVMLGTISVGTLPGISGVLGARYEAAGGGGAVAVTIEFPVGVAVKSTSLMCTQLLNFTHPGPVYPTSTAHGFFAPDK